MTNLSPTFLPDHHLYTASDAQISFRRFKEERDGTVRAEVTLSTGLSDAGRIAGPTRLNLLAASSIKQLSNICDGREDRINWYELLSEACAVSVERLRDGQPLELVNPDADHQRHWVIDPFLEADGYTVLFARGGSGKSFLAAAIAIAISAGIDIFGEVHQQGPVAYLDWEASKGELDSRVTRLARDLGTPSPQVWYRHEEQSLHAVADTLAPQFKTHGVVAAVVDSKGMACSGSPEGAEAVLELNRAVRKLGVPVLLIDHVSKGALKGDDPDMAYGSVYTEYQARLAWKVVPDWSPGSVTLKLTNTKANNGPKRPSLDVTLSFVDDRVALSTDHRAPTPGVVDDQERRSRSQDQHPLELSTNPADYLPNPAEHWQN